MNMIKLSFCLLCALRAHAKILWGSATAAYQVEGYREADGRQPSIWDAFDTANVSSFIPWKKPNGRFNVKDGDNASKGDLDYVQYPQSVQLVKDYGFGAMRLSISWTRVMTYTKDTVHGNLTWKRNLKGINHYKNVLKEYKRQGIQTALTMFHWDMPLAVEEFADSKGCGSAWLCHDIIPEIFAQYAELLLSEYHDLTDWWITLNEPWTVINQGYAGGSFAPGRCSNRTLCYRGNEHTEPYSAAKGMLLAHARAFRLWEKFGRPGSGCGIVLNSLFNLPFTSSDADHAAAQRMMEFQAPLFSDPTIFGRWPASVVERVGRRLPVWTAKEKKLVFGTHDGHFFLNHYTSRYTRAVQGKNCGFHCDMGAEMSGLNFTSGNPIGRQSSLDWLFNYGPGLGKLVEWLHRRYPNVSFLITESGWGDVSSTKEAAMGPDDLHRCNYYRDYLGNLSAVVARENITVKAFFTWSLLDNYEWNSAFSVRFGLTYVDYATGKRSPKGSAMWFRQHIVSLSELPTDGAPLPACGDEPWVMVKSMMPGSIYPGLASNHFIGYGVVYWLPVAGLVALLLFALAIRYFTLRSKRSSKYSLTSSDWYSHVGTSSSEGSFSAALSNIH